MHATEWSLFSFDNFPTILPQSHTSPHQRYRKSLRIGYQPACNAPHTNLGGTSHALQWDVPYRNVELLTSYILPIGVCFVFDDLPRNSLQELLAYIS